MDANGLRAWMIGDERQWRLESDAVQYERTSRTLRLARHRETIAYPVDEAGAAALLGRVPESIDVYGTRAFWSGGSGSVRSAGAVPGDVLLWSPPGTDAVTDVALGFDDFLYVAVAGRITIIDPRERVEPTEAAGAAGFSAWRLAAHPGGGVWALDPAANKVARLFGSPSLVRPHPPYAPNTFRPAVENSDPPRLVVLADVAWPASERPVALASSAGGDLALLLLTSGALAHVRVLSPGRALGSARTLAGVTHALQSRLCVGDGSRGADAAGC